MPGILYLIPNTLGQAQADQLDSLAYVIPPGVQEITAGIEYFIAENAKSTRAYLKLVAAKHPLTKPLQDIRIAELNVKTDASSLSSLLVPILAGQNAGLISEAGLPAVADPGSNLVRLAHACGIIIRPLVGPSSLLLAIMASGLNGQSFAFNGYLPIDAKQRAIRIVELENLSRKERQTQLFIETPYRNGVVLEALATTCAASTLICVATDLTLPWEVIKTQAAMKWKIDLASGHAPDFHKKPTVFLFLAI
jgi:16S rRNA (cytidine1402-2'-O)-methyltransferase